MARAGLKCLSIDIEQSIDLKATPEHDAESAIGLAAGWCGHAIDNFFLQHEMHVDDLLPIVEQVKQQRCRDVVRQVANDA